MYLTDGCASVRPCLHRIINKGIKVNVLKIFLRRQFNHWKYKEGEGE